jgi:integrase
MMCELVGAQAGAHMITLHELRHTFGTQMAAAGAPLRAIQEWVGHADAETTEIYRHYAPDPTHGAALVERAFGGGDAQRTIASDRYARKPYV